MKKFGVTSGPKVKPQCEDHMAAPSLPLNREQKTIRAVQPLKAPELQNAFRNKWDINASSNDCSNKGHYSAKCAVLNVMASRRTYLPRAASKESEHTLPLAERTWPRVSCRPSAVLNLNRAGVPLGWTKTEWLEQNFFNHRQGKHPRKLVPSADFGQLEMNDQTQLASKRHSSIYRRAKKTREGNDQQRLAIKQSVNTSRGTTRTERGVPQAS